MTPGPCLTALTLADPPALWSELGFDVTECRCEVGGSAGELLGTHPTERSGILGWRFARPADLPAAGVPQALLILLSAALTIAVLTVLPETMQAARRTPASAPAAEVPSFGLTGDAS